MTPPNRLWPEGRLARVADRRLSALEARVAKLEALRPSSECPECGERWRSRHVQGPYRRYECHNGHQWETP